MVYDLHHANRRVRAGVDFDDGCREAAVNEKGRTVMIVRILTCGMLVFFAMPLDARNDLLTMQVTPSVAIAPAHLVVRTIIQANQANRAIEISAESGDFYRSSEIPLDGDNAPRKSQVEFRSVPGGQYIIRAVLKGSNEEPLATVRQQVNVVENRLDR
jgi:hypothetical protein